MMPGTNDLGPFGPGVNETYEMPNFGDSAGANYSWMKDCSDAATPDGTVWTARMYNRMLQYLRRACDGMGIPRDESDGDRLLKAIQRADRPVANLGDGQPVYHSDHPTSRAHQLRSVKGVRGINATLSTDGNVIEIDPDGLPSQVPLGGLGAGIGVWAGLISGVNRIRTVRATNGITASVDSDGALKLEGPGSPTAQLPGLKGIAKWDAAGTYTWNKPAGVQAVLAIITGGGQAGTAGTELGGEGGNGGHAGGTAFKYIDVTALSNLQAVVGAGAIGSNAQSGGTSQVTGHASATGGAGNVPGVGVGGDFNIRGGYGHVGDAASSGQIQSGVGGASFWGGGKGDRTLGNSAPGAPGSGGMGASANSSGNGVDGCVLFLMF